MKLLYRHSDGRLIEISGDNSHAEIWLIYPHRELLEGVDTFDAAKATLPEGFELDPCKFAPPCPTCAKPSPMNLETGMYMREDCERNNCACPF